MRRYVRCRFCDAAFYLLHLRVKINSNLKNSMEYVCPSCGYMTESYKFNEDPMDKVEKAKNNQCSHHQKEMHK